MDASELALRVVVALKGLNELVMLTLIGQAALWLLAGRSRHTNPVYAAFNIVGARVIRACRRITPSRVSERLIPPIAALWLLLIEVLLIAAKIYLVFGLAATPGT